MRYSQDCSYFTNIVPTLELQRWRALLCVCLNNCSGSLFQERYGNVASLTASKKGKWSYLQRARIVAL